MGGGVLMLLVVLFVAPHHSVADTTTPQTEACEVIHSNDSTNKVVKEVRKEEVHMFLLPLPGFEQASVVLQVKNTHSNLLFSAGEAQLLQEEAHSRWHDVLLKLTTQNKQYVAQVQVDGTPAQFVRDKNTKPWISSFAFDLFQLYLKGAANWTFCSRAVHPSTDEGTTTAATTTNNFTSTTTTPQSPQLPITTIATGIVGGVVLSVIVILCVRRACRSRQLKGEDMKESLCYSFLYLDKLPTDTDDSELNPISKLARILRESVSGKQATPDEGSIELMPLGTAIDQ